MMRVGILVNPDAGLGGRLGFKGSDGRAAEARAAGAQDRAGPRMEKCLAALPPLEIELIACGGRMGADLIPAEFTSDVVTTPAESTDASDTTQGVHALLEAGIEVLLYAGGDGTTRDIVTALTDAGRNDLPIIGVPGGVKMHSGCFAASPKAAAEVLAAFVNGDLLAANTEVMDLDEEVYRQGRWSVRMYGEAMTPASPRWMQGAKMRVSATEEDEVIEAIGDHVREEYVEDDERLIIWGSGGTLRRMAEALGFQATLLGIDATRGTEQIGVDLSESDLLRLFESYPGPRTLLVSPMGGQGFLLGRGNLQLSPEVLREIGLDGIMGVVTPAKMVTITQLRIDTGDEALDAAFAEKKYLKVLQGYRTTRLLRVAID